MNLKDYIRSIPDYPKKGILFRDITTLIKDENAFEDLIISTIPSKDILSKEDIKAQKSLKNFQFIENLNDALSFLKDKRFNGPKVIFGSHYIAKYVYKFFDFSFDKGNI